MASSRADFEMFYAVRPGDTFSSIAAKRPSIFGRGNIASEVVRLRRLNPHVVGDRLQPNELLSVGAPTSLWEGGGVSAWELGEMSRTWRSASVETQEMVRRNYDVLDWIANGKDSVDLANQVGKNTQAALAAVPKFKVALEVAERLKVTAVYRQLLALRNEAVVFLNSVAVSVERYPVLLLRFTKNGFYSNAQRLQKMIQVADKIRLGKIITIADIGIESGKVIATAVETENAVKTARQGARSVGRLTAGAVATAGALRACTVLLPLGPWGIGTCVAVTGVGVLGGGDLGEWIGSKVGGAIEKRILPPLP